MIGQWSVIGKEGTKGKAGYLDKTVVVVVVVV